jgi:hypothetical protein
MGKPRFSRWTNFCASSRCSSYEPDETMQHSLLELNGIYGGRAMLTHGTGEPARGGMEKRGSPNAADL